MSPFLVAILAGLLGMLGWGLADLFAKKTIDAIGDITTLVIAHLFGTAFVIVIALYEAGIAGHSIAFPASAYAWLGFAFFGALQAVVYLLVYVGFGKGQVAVLNPIFSSFSGVVALVSILFLGEVVSIPLALGLLVIFAGIMLMNVDIEGLRASRFAFLRVPGFTQVGSATVLAALWTLGWSSFVSGGDWLSAALWMYVAMTLTLLLYAVVRKVPLVVRVPGAWKYLVCIGLFEMGAYVAISWGYGATSATAVVALLSGAFSLPTIIGARLWLKERTTELQLWGSVGIVLGVALIALV